MAFNPSPRPLTDAELDTALTSLSDLVDTSKGVEIDTLLADLRVDLFDAGASAQISSTPHSASQSLHRPRRRRPWRLAGVAATVALVAGGLVISPYGLDLTGRDSHGIISNPSGTAHAAELLEAAAQAVQPDPPVREGQYWQITTRGTYRSAVPGQTQERLEITYVPAVGDQATLVDSRWWRPGLFGGRKNERHEYYRRDQTNDPSLLWVAPSTAFLTALPRDVTKLRSLVYAQYPDGGSRADQEAFGTIRGLLMTGRVPADLRASLLRVLSTVPGVSVTSVRIDVDGADGTAFGLLDPMGGVRNEIIVDTDHGVVIGLRKVKVGAGSPYPDFPDGEVIDKMRITRELIDELPSGLPTRS
ncbi:CU044_5270 family protein [Austwickia chelonae]|uniref:CU044_5270 family protein n=1 Tax=Austwickia chelonae TaxID=100225 RepID=UPI000E23B80E|nr:CU044_5270 family protein [Austwickia chelonae]